ncbi:hypothetical protein BWQ96_10337 [Gracilariopsis chorda]|uniref:Uncharacterized protein n=1 Tax=Gracilariopsis chorda TaxID=448386 RepID=A0A2V3ICZ0_9FLOR|nr:hypothetical protein BWQ96_10337 [Gracilariopsis chorda]|eukprot:PXF39953.1 hypothetical protein BWQ96_10337 [Gracilariopsis chorda]
MTSIEEGQPLGGVNDALSSLQSFPTIIAALAVVLAALQAVLCMESVDPCRLSRRKMNILLGLELVETAILVASELLSFLELRSSLVQAFPSLYFVAPCLLAAGILQLLAEVYFTMAVVTKSRISWIPVSAMGSTSAFWEIIPFSVTLLLSFTVIGWRFRWWLRGNAVSESVALDAVQSDPALKAGVMGFAVGWTVSVSALLFITLLLTDCADDGPSYVAGLRYLWRPDQWLDEQHDGTKLWYRRFESNDQAVQEYIASAVLDSNVLLPRGLGEIQAHLERTPLHVGNAIVGNDRKYCKEEDRKAHRLQRVVMLAEHVVVLPLLIVLIVIIARNHDNLDKLHFDAIRQLADATVILAFVEVAIGLKNLIWGISGTGKKEFSSVSDDERLQSLNVISYDYCQARATSPAVRTPEV